MHLINHTRKQKSINHLRVDARNISFEKELHQDTWEGGGIMVSAPDRAARAPALAGALRCVFG